MSRQEATNTFNDGMIKDMNPLTTPNTVLTDCVNGTLITYNGNEFVLQNDMGNYPLPLAKLGANYIPVGIKEYGNTIYIVSYNPIDQKCQIGSYPSPKRNFGEEHDGDGGDITVIPKFEGTITYTDLNDSLKAYLYSNKDELKLNPGDLYYLYNSEREDLFNTNSWWTVDHYILTEESKLVPIKIDKEKIGVSKRSSIDGDYSVVNWTTVGWMAIKSRIANIEKFDIFIENLTYSPFQTTSDDSTLKCDLVFQIVLTDELFNNTEGLKQLWEQLSFKVYPKNKLAIGETIQISDGSNTTPVIDGAGPSGYGTTLGLEPKFTVAKYDSINATILTYRVSLTIKGKLNDGVLQQTLIFTPILDDLAGNKTIIYDPFKTELLISSNNILSSDTINLLDTYKYRVENKEISINYTVNVPSLSLSTIKGEYQIYQLNASSESDPIKKGLIQTLQGQNIVDLSFDSEFKQNEIYEFRVTIYEEIDENKNIIKKISKPLITCPLFNNFYFTKNDFDQIYWDEWLSTLKDYGPTYSEIKITNKDEVTFTPDEKTIEYPSKYVAPTKSGLEWPKQEVVGKFVANYDLDSQINETQLIPKTNDTYQGNLFSDYTLERKLLYTIGELDGETDILSDGTSKVSYNHNVKYTVSFATSKFTGTEINKKFLYNYMSGYKDTPNVGTRDYGLLVRGFDGDGRNWMGVEEILKYDPANPKMWKTNPGLYENNSDPVVTSYVKRAADAQSKVMETMNDLLKKADYSKYFMYIVCFYPSGMYKFKARRDDQWTGGFPEEIKSSGGYGVLIRTRQTSGAEDYKILLCYNPTITTGNVNKNFSFNPLDDEETQLSEINRIFYLIGKHAYILIQGSTINYLKFDLNKEISGDENISKRWTNMLVSHSFKSVKYGQTDMLNINEVNTLVASTPLKDSNNFKKSAAFINDHLELNKTFDNILAPTSLVVISLDDITGYSNWLGDLNEEYINQEEELENQVNTTDVSQVPWNTIGCDPEIGEAKTFVEALTYDLNTDKIFLDASKVQGEGETCFYSPIASGASRGCWNAIVSGLELPYIKETNG